MKDKFKIIWITFLGFIPYLVIISAMVAAYAGKHLEAIFTLILVLVLEFMEFARNFILCNFKDDEDDRSDT